MRDRLIRPVVVAASAVVLASPVIGLRFKPSGKNATGWCSSALLLGCAAAQAAGPEKETSEPGPQRGRPVDGSQPPAGPPQATPRLADGTPNLGRVPGERGIWSVRIVLDFGNRVVGHEVPEPMNRGPSTTAGGAHMQPWVPFMPWSAAVYDYNLKNEAKYDPEGYCLPPGGPRLMATPYPMEILQLPEQKRIVMIFEGGAHVWREVYMDGRPHPQGDELNPTYLGHSVGHWEGDTLVVDVVGFNEGTWLDPVGHPHTDMLHVIEKYSRPNKSTLHYEATIDDPAAYTKPWTVGWNIPWAPNGQLSEYICQENNRYLWRLRDDFGNPVFGKKP
jgi:hypothetical protein